MIDEYTMFCILLILGSAAAWSVLKVVDKLMDITLKQRFIDMFDEEEDGVELDL